MVKATAKDAFDVHCVRCNAGVMHISAGDTVQIVKATLQNNSEVTVNTASDIPQDPKGIIIRTQNTNAYMCGCCYTEHLEDIRNEN